MIIKYDASLVIDFLSGIVPDEFLNDPDIIIAGGSCFSLYMTDRILRNLQPGERSIMKKHLEGTPIAKYSDVDLWILKGSVSPNLSFFQTSSIDMSREEKPNEWQLKSPHYSPYSLSGQKRRVIGKSGTLLARKSSQWAVTYDYSSPDCKKKQLPIQCITKEQDSVESLLNTFDIGPSSVAVHRGEFYVHDSLSRSLEQNEILYNAGCNFKNKSFASRLFNGLRLFKYHDKTGFDFSKEMYLDMMNLMIDASSFYVEVKKKNVKIGGQITMISTGSEYEEIISTRESIFRMISQLAPQFQSKMMKMKHHQEHDALFLSDSDQFPLKLIIDFDKPKAVAATAPITNPAPPPAVANPVIRSMKVGDFDFE